MKCIAIICAAAAVPAILLAAIAPDTAWEEVSPTNKVKDIVEQFSPPQAPPDFSTNNAELVETIQATAPEPDFSPSNATLRATIEATAPAPDFSTSNAELVETIQATAPEPDHVKSTNMVLSTGLPGRVTVNADLSITETPEPAYSVTTNALPYLPSVITGRTTRASEDLLSYEYEGVVNGSHSWRTSLPADRWTSMWYGDACPSGITYNATANRWYLHPGNGTTVEMPAADFPPEKVMLGEVPLVASYRMGMSAKVWTAAPYSWTDVQGGEYSEDFPHYETNHFNVVRTRIVRRDEVPDWSLAATKPTYTAAEVGALPASKYLTTSHWYSGNDVSFFGVGTTGLNAGLHEDGYLEATEPGGMATDWVPLVYNAQYKTQGIRYRRYRTSTGTNETFDVNLAYPQESGTIATREWTEHAIDEAAPVQSVNGATGVVTLTASDVGAYSAANGATLAGQVATIGAHLNAEDARFVVTNYNSETHTPEAYVEIKLPDESWSRIWSETTRWTWLFECFLPTNYYDKAAVDAALAEKADRAWGFYESTTGAYAPEGYTWISSEKIAIAANLAYQRTVTTEGAIWVLESNGTVTETGGLTNGFFRISDDEGNSLFEIVKGNKRTVGADASSCQVVAGFTPTKLQIGYSIVSDVHPTLYVCESLTTQNWKSETDPDCIANVSWSGPSGAYVVEVQGKSAYPSLFVKATYEVGGETYISNAAPVSMQYIMIGGVKYSVGTATISGNTVLTLTVAP